MMEEQKGKMMEEQLCAPPKLDAIVRVIISINPITASQAVKEPNGKAFCSLVGQVMKATRGRANPDLVVKMMKEELANCDEFDTNKLDAPTLRLIQTIRYLIGIAERGEGRKVRDDETAEEIVLGYVKRIERELAEAQAEIQEQARLLGISGSTEAKLLAEISRLQSSTTTKPS